MSERFTFFTSPGHDYPRKIQNQAFVCQQRRKGNIYSMNMTSSQTLIHRPHSHQVTGVRCTEIAARQSWPEYFSRTTTDSRRQGWLIKDFSVLSEMRSICEQPSFRNTRAAFSLPVERASHDTTDPHRARTCWMVMGQWLQQIKESGFSRIPIYIFLRTVNDLSMILPHIPSSIGCRWSTIQDNSVLNSYNDVTWFWYIKKLKLESDIPNQAIANRELGTLS